MAIFHLSVQVFQRSAGRSAFAGAMYRAAEKGTCVYDGRVHDYTAKNWVVAKEIILPEHIAKTHPEFYNRQNLWNTIEWSEKSSNAQLAREVELSLPIELTQEQQMELLRDYVQKNFVDQGMIADICVHNPPDRDDLGRAIARNRVPTRDPNKMQFYNPHAHIMLSMRPMDKHGNWESKKQKEYICKRNGKTENLTSAEFALAKKDGWEKQYQYQIGKKKVWMTPTEAERQGLLAYDRVSPHARATAKGRPNETTAQWNSKENVSKWRKAWEDAVNERFQTLGMNERIDCRSHADRGLKELPTEHQGSEATNIERRARRLRRNEQTTAGTVNRDIRAYNESVKNEKDIQQAVDNQIENTAMRLELSRGKMIKGTHIGSVAAKAIHAAEQASKENENTVETMTETFDAVAAANEKAIAVIENLTRLLEECSRFQLGRRRELQAQIDVEKQGIDDRNSYLQAMMKRHNVSNIEDTQRKREDKEAINVKLDKYQNKKKTADDAVSAAKNTYNEEMKHVPEVYQKQVQKARETVRPYVEKEIEDDLADENLSNYQIKTAEREVDKLLGLDKSKEAPEKERSRSK